MKWETLSIRGMQKVRHFENRDFSTSSPMSHFVIFCLSPPPPHVTHQKVWSRKQWKKSLPQYNLVQYLTFFHQKQVLKYEMLEKKAWKLHMNFFWLSDFTPLTVTLYPLDGWHPHFGPYGVRLAPTPFGNKVALGIRKKYVTRLGGEGSGQKGRG